jgi:hypothetical protein
MTEAYNYTLAQFTGLTEPEPNPSLLKRQVEDDAAIVTPLTRVKEVYSDPVDPAVDFVRFVFDSALDPAEVTALDTLVAAHTGLLTTGKLQRGRATGEQSTSETTPQTALEKTFKALVGGTYAFVFSSETKVLNGTDRCMVVIRIDGASVARHFEGDSSFSYHGGTLFQDFEDGDQPVVAVEYEVKGTNGDTASIRKVSVTLHLVETPEDLP